MQRIIATGMMLISLLGMAAQNNNLTRPADYFGFDPGSDRKLFTYEQMVSYFQELDGQSPRILMEQIGTSPEGRSMYIAFISSEKNLSNLDTLKTINRELEMYDKKLIQKPQLLVLNKIRDAHASRYQE